jgi:hypothetical protein
MFGSVSEKPYIQTNTNDMNEIGGRDGVSSQALELIALDGSQISDLICHKGKPPPRDELVQALGQLEAEEDKAMDQMKRVGDNNGAAKIQSELKKLTEKVADDGGQGGGKKAAFLADAKKVADEFEHGAPSAGDGPGSSGHAIYTNGGVLSNPYAGYPGNHA